MHHDPTLPSASPENAPRRSGGSGDIVAGLLLVAFFVAPLVAWLVPAATRSRPAAANKSAAVSTPSAAVPNDSPPPGAVAGADRTAAAAPDPDGTLPLGFPDLGFAPPNEDQLYRSGGPPPQFLDHAPASIRALDGRVVRIRGFMIPLKVESGRLSECAIVASQLSCCFGVAPRFCEFVIVRLPPEGPPPPADIPLSFKGTLHVGDVVEDGLWATFYRLDCTAVTR